jgi:hypothetical protein
VTTLTIAEEAENRVADKAHLSERRDFTITVVIAASILYALGMIYYANVRPLDGDEGFYTTAARLVSEGKLPYRDFFYQQAPLLPYLYSCVWSVCPRSLVAMRVLSALCGSIAVLLWGLWCFAFGRRFSVKAGLATFAVVLMNPYSISWNVVVKTFAFANLFMTIATLSLYLALRFSQLRWFFVAGVALGACASVRSFYGPLLFVVFVWLLWQKPKGLQASHSAAAIFLAGCVLGLLPMIVSFLRDPAAFLFNNLGYHHLDAGYMWDGTRLIEGYRSVGHTALVYFATIAVRLIGFHPYFTIELIIGVMGIVSIRKLRHSFASPYQPQDYLYFQIALLMLFAYTVVALLPFPPYDQYFDSPLVPLVVPFVMEGIRLISRTSRNRVVALVLVLALLCLPEVRHETRENSWDPVWRVPIYRQVSQTIADNSRPEDIVMSFWPGFVFESGRQYFSGLEDHFAFRVISELTPQERTHYHIIAHDRILQAVANREASLLVIPPWIVEYYNNLSQNQIQEFHHAIDDNYVLIQQISGIGIYRRREQD